MGSSTPSGQGKRGMKHGVETADFVDFEK